MIATEPRRLRRSLTTAAALVLLAVPLSACTSAGTDFIYTPAQGVNARDGDVDVLNALLVSSEDGEGRFIAGLANNDQQQGDALTGVAGAGEDASVQVQLVGSGVELQPGGFVQIADLGSRQEGTQILVSGEDVVAGDFIRLSLQFANADAVEVHVPVVEPGEDFGAYSTALPPESPSEFPATELPQGPAPEESPAPEPGATEDE